MIPHKHCLALLLGSFVGLQTCTVAYAQSSVLTGKISHDSYQQKIITQDARFDNSAGSPVLNPAQNPVSVATVQRPVTSVRLAPQPAVVRTVYVRDNRTFFQRHPKVKAASIGAGVGAGLGAVTGLVTHHGIMRGALIGAGTGAGVGLVRSSVVMKRHPIIRNVTTGTLVGLGIGGAASGHGHRRILAGGGIGAAVGLGASLLNGEFR